MRRWFFHTAIKVSAVWVLWWLIGSVIIQIGFPKLVEFNREHGGATKLTLNSVGGFPGHFGIDLSDVTLTNLNRTTSWQGDGLELKLRAWKPTHANIVFPQSHSLKIPGRRYDIQAEKNEIEIAIAPAPSLPFKGIVAQYENTHFRSSLGMSGHVDHAYLNIWATKDISNGFDIGLNLQNLTLPLQMRREIDRSLSLSETVSSVLLDAKVGFTAPWDRYTIQGPYPQPTTIDIKNFDLQWDALSFSAHGKLDIAADGQARGTIQLETENWRGIVELAQANGALSPDNRALAESSLNVLSGGGDALSAPLSFQDGMMLLGPVPIGKAPLFRIERGR